MPPSMRRRAAIESITADIDDSVLKSPRDGRVQYRVAQPGEVLAAGGRVLNMVDLERRLHDLLPADRSRPAASPIGARFASCSMPRPQYVIPAKATFVADVAQFTPEDGRDGGGAPEADVPHQGADRPGAAARQHIRASEDRSARHGLRQARSDMPSGPPICRSSCRQ